MPGSNEWGLMKIALNAAVPLRIGAASQADSGDPRLGVRFNSIQATLDEGARMCCLAVSGAPRSSTPSRTPSQGWHSCREEWTSWVCTSRGSGAG